MARLSARSGRSQGAQTSTKYTDETATEQIEEWLGQQDAAHIEPAYDLARERDLTQYVLLFEAAKELGVEPWDIDIEESSWLDKGYEIKLGKREYMVMPTEEDAEEAARDRVREDLKDEPEIFNRDFIEQHVDEERLKKYVYDSEMENDYVEELAASQVEDFWRLARQLDVDGAVPDHDEDGGEMEPTPTQLDRVKHAYAEDRAQAPWEFFRDIYGDEATKYAIEAAGIDIESATDAAVSADGWAHFLNIYDGKYEELPGGGVLWRTN